MVIDDVLSQHDVGFDVSPSGKPLANMRDTKMGSRGQRQVGIALPGPARQRLRSTRERANRTQRAAHYAGKGLCRQALGWGRGRQCCEKMGKKWGQSEFPADQHQLWRHSWPGNFTLTPFSSLTPFFADLKALPQPWPWRYTPGSGSPAPAAAPSPAPTRRRGRRARRTSAPARFRPLCEDGQS